MKQLGLHNNVIVPRGPKKTNHPLPHLDPPQMKAQEIFYMVLCWVKPHNGGIPKNKGPRMM